MNHISRSGTLVAFGSLLLIGLALVPSAAATSDNVVICHATGSATNPYVLVNASAAGVYNGHLGASHQNESDIIPPFTYNETVHSQNWDAEHQAIFDNGCVVATSTTTTTSSTATETTSETDTTSSNTTTTTQIPFFPSLTALAVGGVGAAVSMLVMLRRRL